MELDLNQEPLDQPHRPVIGFGPIVSEMESVHGHIEERIRRLEAVTSRARQRQRSRQGHTPLQITNVTASLEERDVQVEDRINSEQVDVAVQESIDESRKMSKRGNAHLVAKALEMDMDPKKEGNESGSFFDCNICLEMAEDPILTCCGHLFCWPCFYLLTYSYSSAKECPVCKGEVTDTGTVPIYGNGSVNSGHQLESTEPGFEVPPRPRAKRIEGKRQQLLNHRTSSPAVDRIQRFSNMVDAMERFHFERTAERTSSSANRHHTSESQALPTVELESNQNSTSLHVSRLRQGAASLSSLSSAMNSAERLVEGLEAYVNNPSVERSHQQSPLVDDRGPTSSIAGATESEIHPPYAASEISFPISISAVSWNDVEEFLAMRNLSSSSSRRRTNGLGASDTDNGISREPTRRRLR
ncbi:E3 ubiquitin-protein like [Quillaja saponaria]|uniref:E3 ubiquitin-protein ligase RMA n=1 Tax=Quillaja saponaria TaxID=32244 RepID=A0AAD7VNU1_QUISA|nr:E3 ubiquitin-protein like [Quillaja saponaria]